MGIGLVLVLNSALAYGAADFVGGAGSRRHSRWRLVLIGQLPGGVPMVACGVLTSAAGARFGVLLVALGQLSSTAGFLPLGANQLFGVAVTIRVAASLKQKWLPCLAAVGWGGTSGVLGATGTLRFLVSTRYTDLGVAAVLASLYPAVTVLLVSAALGERLGNRQRLGIGIGIGIYTLAVATLTIG